MADVQAVEEVKAEKVDTWLEKIPEGLRKFVVLAPAMWGLLVAAIVALFTNDMTEATFAEYTIGVLAWGGGIFAGANVAEHVIRAAFDWRKAKA